MNAYFKQRLVIIIFILLQIISVAKAQDEHSDKYDVYYLVIGSGHYIKDKNMDRPEAISSAHKMDLILKGIQAKGNELISTQDHPITRNSLLKAIYDLKKTIRHDKAKNPLIIFYYMGHGLGSNDYQQFIALGDYDFNKWINLKFEDVIGNGYFSEGAITADALAQVFYLFSKDDNDSYLDEIYTAENIDNLKNEFDKIQSKYGNDKDMFIEIDKNVQSLSKEVMQLQNSLIESNDYHNAIRKYQENSTKKIYEKFKGKFNHNDPKQIAEFNKIRSTAYNEFINSSENKKIENAFKNMEKKYSSNKNREKTKDMLKLIEKAGMVFDVNAIESMKSQKDTKSSKEILNNIPAIYKESKKLKQHVPYLLILDSCSNGIQGAFEYQMRKTTEWTSIFAKDMDSLVKSKGLISSAPKFDQSYSKQQLESLENAKQNMTEFVVNLSRGETFRKYGTLFFAANPGYESYAIGVDEFTLNNEATGVLARRFELSINNAKSSGSVVSLRRFIELFDNSELDLKTDRPFSWFSMPDEVSKITFIKN